MIKNITQSWISSLTGLVIIAAGLYTGITAKQSWTEASVIIGLGFGYLIVKDPHK